MDETDVQDALIELHPASFAWAMVCCRDRDLAEEVLQSVYVKVLDGRAPFRGRSSFRTWLFTVVRNTAASQRRKRWWSGLLRLEFESLAEFAGSTYDDNPSVEADGEPCVVRAAVEKLPQRQRQIAHLVFYEDLTVADAAGVMGVTVGTARQHYARAKESLKVILEPRYRADEAIVR